MDIYVKGVVGEAWQYNGDSKSMPGWVKSSARHHVEIAENGTVRYWKGNGSIIVDKGDWFVLIHGCMPPEVYSDDAFKHDFTFSDPARCKSDSVASQKYRCKTRHGSCLAIHWTTSSSGASLLGCGSDLAP